MLAHWHYHHPREHLAGELGARDAGRDLFGPRVNELTRVATGHPDTVKSTTCPPGGPAGTPRWSTPRCSAGWQHQIVHRMGYYATVTDRGVVWHLSEGTVPAWRADAYTAA